MKISIGGKAIETDAIAIVGEYTTADGPFLDDHFLIVITYDGQMTEIAIRGTEIEKILLNLVSALGVPFALGLSNRTDFSSRVLYPSLLLDRPLFIKKPNNILQQRSGVFLHAQGQQQDEWIIDPEITSQVDKAKK